MANDPTMQAKADLIYAILSMDSYNRGYGFGISGLDQPILDANGNISNTVAVGDFVVSSQSQIQPSSDAFNSGFYAIAYNNATTGQTIIAYRGTDSATGSATSGGSDVWPGYGIALGLTNSAQGDLALKFYKAVDTASVTDLTLTGHSLGSGLTFCAGANDNQITMGRAA